MDDDGVSREASSLMICPVRDLYQLFQRPAAQHAKQHHSVIAQAQAKTRHNN